MYPITTELKNLFLSGNRKRLRLTLNNADVEDKIITEADVVSDSFTIDRYCATGNKIEVGSAISAELTLTLQNIDGRFNGYTFEGSDLFVEIGVENGEYIPCGKFTVDEPPRSAFHIALKALDYMMRFDREVDWTKLSFPMSIKQLLIRIAELCEVDISADIDLDSLPNIDETVMKAPTSTNINYRQILQWIAQITGTCAFMDWVGELRLSWFTETEEALTPSNRYIGGNIHEKDITVTGVSISTGNGTFVSGSADYALTVEGNELIYAGTEQYIADNIFAAIGAFSYRPYQCNSLPMPFLYPLDVITYVDGDGNRINTVVTNHTFSLNGASALSAVGETATKNGYSAKKGLTKKEIDAAIKEAMKDFDSTAEHIYVKYSPFDGGRDENGNLVWTDTAEENTIYLGTCATNEKTAPTDPTRYNWVKIRGADGKNGKDGKDGQDGENGKDGQDGNDGRGVSKVETEYRLSTSDTSLSSGYTWGTDAPTWQDGLFLWTRLATTYTDNTTEYSDPVVDASWKKTSVVDAASKELNETLANALGLHVTEYPVGTSKIRYYHSNPSLTDSKSGDTILVFNAKGFGVCTTGWNNGSPQFQYGTTFDGKAVWNILAANKISADLIEAGSIKSLPSAKIQTTINLDNGTYTSTAGDTKITIQGGEVDEESGAETTPAGILLDNLSDGSTIRFSVSGIQFMSQEYVKAYTTYAIALALDIVLGTNNAPALKPEDPYFSSVAEKDIKTTNLHCKNIYIVGDSDGNEYNLMDALSMMSEQVNLLSESLTALQEKYLALEEALGQQHEHTPATAVRENVVSATCTAQGSYDEVVYCSSCGEELSRTKKYTSALGHNYTSVVTPPTSTSGGYTTHTCQTCGSSYTDNYTDAIKYFTATIYSSGAGSGDVVRIAKNTSGEDWGKNQFSVGDKFCFYAEANSGKVISSVQVTSNGVVTTYSAKDLEDVGALTDARTKLTYPYNLITVTSALLGTSISMTVLFEEPMIYEGVETSVNIPTQREKVYLKFVPQYSGSYTFESFNLEDLDPDGYIYNADKSTELLQDRAGSKGFSCAYDNFVAGNIYYLAAEIYNGTGTLTVKVSYNGSSGGSSGGGSTPTYAEDTIVDGVLYIGTNTTSIDNTYQGNTEITKVIIPNNVTGFATDGSDVGGQCFRECTNLTEVVVGSGITKITYACFFDCSRLAKVTIPASVTTISEFAFGRTALTDVYYKGNQEQWTSINIESNNTPLTNATIHYNS